jgi:hypothetical protein
VRETERRLADGLLQARDLHQVLLATGQNDSWASARQAALVALTERPEMAVTVVHLESQRLGSPAAFEESSAGAAFTARAVLAVDGQPVAGRPGRGASKKAARQLAALSLVATLAGLPDPAGQAQDPGTGDSGSRAVGPEEMLAAIRAGTPPVPRLAEGLAARRLSDRELHDLLLAADPVAWAAARKVAWEQLARSPQLAGGVLSLYTQSRGQTPVRYVTIADGVPGPPRSRRPLVPVHPFRPALVARPGRVAAAGRRPRRRDPGQESPLRPGHAPLPESAGPRASRSPPAGSAT